MSSDRRRAPLWTPEGPSPLEGRNILVTGGTGSFGQAFVRRALGDGATRVVVFSRDELKQAQMRGALSDPRLRFFLGDVRNSGRIVQALNGCDTVIHAAAMKRIEACESEPGEAIATNIDGTQNVALAAIHCRVERAVFLSTDKAPCAHTLYGMTKAVAERAWIQSNVFAAGTFTKLSATRYGNVLDSRGSVVGLWRGQRARGEPLTVTDPAASRFWMTIAQAVDLVCLALSSMRGGEVFVPKVPSSPILTLARAIAECGGQVYAPGHVVTGLRPGERLHETLISDDEMRTTYGLASHYVIEPEGPTWGFRSMRHLATQDDGLTSYRSDTNPQQFSVEELREMIA